LAHNRVCRQASGIDLLKKIYIQHQQRKGQLIAPGPLEFFSQALVKIAAVVNGHQGIGDGFPLQTGYAPQIDGRLLDQNADHKHKHRSAKKDDRNNQVMKISIAIAEMKAISSVTGNEKDDQ